jgi:hypothetical protein
MRMSPSVPLTVVVAVIIGVGTWFGLRHGRSKPVEGASVSYPPLPHQVRVEVLNPAKVPGASRVATLTLRSVGLDVIYYGNGDTIRARDRNQVIVRRGDTTGVGRAVAALGGADVSIASDSTREADLTVLIGRTYATSRPVPPPH